MVAAVFDGVGGLGNGEEASFRAARYLSEMLMAPSLQADPNLGPGKVVADLVLGLHTRLKTESQQPFPEAPHMLPEIVAGAPRQRSEDDPVQCLVQLLPRLSR